jgi:tetraacyldisaccharide 4'-kinase
MKRPWLAPLVPLYCAGLAWRELRLKNGAVRKLEWPVVSIGNLSTGGSGKTPLTIALSKLLATRGVHVDVLSRGYGRKTQEPACVDPSGTSQQFGDEPLLITRKAGVPVYVAPQRYEAGRMAEADATLGAQETLSGQHEFRRSPVTAAHILDDGFQHRQLDRAVDILLLNREDWHDHLLPAGNLREGLRAAMRAEVIALPGDDVELEAELKRWGWAGPIWRLKRCMEVLSLEGPVFAFCGIARPEQFFAGLENAGLHLAGRKAFRDHCNYSEQAVKWLLEQAKRAGARALITTEKDAVRLGPLVSAFPADLPLKTAKLAIEIENADSVIDWLLARLATGESTHAL